MQRRWLVGQRGVAVGGDEDERENDARAVKTELRIAPLQYVTDAEVCVCVCERR